jgi:hypothetical protein
MSTKNAGPPGISAESRIPAKEPAPESATKVNNEVLEYDPRHLSTINATFLEFEFVRVIDADHKRRMAERDAWLDAYIFRKYGVWPGALDRAPNYGCKWSERTKRFARFWRWMDREFKAIRLSLQPLPLWKWAKESGVKP